MNYIKKISILICIVMLIGISHVNSYSEQEVNKISSGIELYSLQEGEEELYYDDGSMEISWVKGMASSIIYAVCFKPSSFPCIIKKFKFYLLGINDYSFKVHVYQQESDTSYPSSELIESFTVQTSGTGWYTHDISDLNITIKSGNFAIGLELSNDYVTLGGDSNQPINNRSWAYAPGMMNWTLVNNSDFMIRAIISSSQPTTSSIGPTTSTTTSTSMQPCLSETIYGEDSEEAELLRYLRDQVLSTTSEGKEIIRLYYEWSPVIIKMVNEDEGFKEEVKQIIDSVLRLIVREAE